MDDQTLQGLRDAHRASPDNHPLRMLLLRGLQTRGELDEAAELIDQAGDTAFASSEDCLTAVQVLQDRGDLEKVLALTDRDEPEIRLLRARALADLGRVDDARETYHKVIAENPTLEDPELGDLVRARVRTVETEGGRPRFRVISRETDEEELPATDDLLVPDPEPVTFADVGGLDAIKKQIHKKIILPFQKPSLFKKFRKRIGGGILMYGPPGCGKTLLARATAGECQASFFNVAISDVLDMFIGESEQKLHALFEKARSSTPAVIFFDEIEALGGKRQNSRESSNTKVVSQFLSEMDGFAKDNEGVLVLGATNVPWSVDPAFRRPGRFDRVLFVPPPDRTAREAVLRIQLDERPVEPGIDLGRLAGATSGFSGADLANVVETAADLAIEDSIERGEERPITAKDLKQSLKEVKPTTIEWLTSARNYARYANEGGQYDDVLEFLEKHGKR